MPELPVTSILINQIRAPLPWKTLARRLASSAVWCDRATAVRTINQWTFEEARQLGLKRCDNSPHDGQIAWYEEHGREETEDAVYRKLQCPYVATKLGIYSSISVYRQEKLAAGSFNTSDVFAALSQVHILEHRGM